MNMYRCVLRNYGVPIKWIQYLVLPLFSYVSRPIYDIKYSRCNNRTPKTSTVQGRVRAYTFRTIQEQFALHYFHSKFKHEQRTQ